MTTTSTPTATQALADTFLATVQEREDALALRHPDHAESQQEEGQ